MENYLHVILTGIAVFPFAALLLTVPYIIYNYHKYGSASGIRVGIVYSFALYLICAYFLVILPLPSVDDVAAMTTPSAQLIPFNFIADIIKESKIEWSKPLTYFSLANRALFTELFNIIMLIPFGMYLRYYFKCSLKKTALFSFFLSLFFELTQLTGLYFIYPRAYRLFDVDDLIANTVGGITGFFAAAPLIKFLPSRSEIDETSFEKGQTISFTRRITSLIIDIFAVITVNIISQAFTGIAKASFPPVLSLIIYFLYFAVFPVFSNGKTLGNYATQTKIADISGKSAEWQQYFIRCAGLSAAVYFPWRIVYYLYEKSFDYAPAGKLFILSAFLGIILYIILAADSYKKN
ncbi:MAG: VanZ family protein [Clostridiales bacterium]|nr:VanZ family protein [Clostridiales bacterium]